MGRRCRGEAPAGYFTLNYYSSPKFNQMSAYVERSLLKEINTDEIIVEFQKKKRK
jgi:hypothetical protein